MQEKTRPLSNGYRFQSRHRFWWLMPTFFAWPTSFLYLGYIVMLLFGFVPLTSGTAWWPILVIAVAMLALLLVDRVEYWRYGEQLSIPTAIRLFTMRLLLIIPVTLLEGLHFENLHLAPALFLILPYFAMIYFGKKIGYGMAVLVSSVYFVEQWWYQPDWYHSRASILLTFLFFLGILIVVFLARAISLEKASRIRAEELLVEVKRSHLQLQAYAEQIATLATAEERNRVAREIHDSLGHALVAINVQLEKALLYHDKHQEETVQAIGDAKRVAKEALQDVRHSVRALRTEQEPFSCIQSMVLLIEQLRVSSLVVEFVVNGSEKRFSRQTLTTLYRVAQEGFTNIQKHAQASVIQVTLHFAEEEAQLSIRDNGSGFDTQLKLQQPQRREQGYGLQGMQERIALVGGDFHLESQPGHGTHLWATVARTGIPIHFLHSYEYSIDNVGQESLVSLQKGTS